MRSTRPPPTPRTRAPPTLARAPTSPTSRAPSPPRPRPSREPTSRPERAVPFVGLTGGIGAGKSTALAALAELGAMTLSTDAVVHELYADDEELRAAVVERWGEDVAPQGQVDRARVAEHAFGGDEGERRWLEGLLWPKVGERVVAFRAEADARSPRPRAAVVETPLLFEAGMEGAYDATIAVVADEEIRAARAAARGHGRLDERSARQLTQAEKAQRADFVVENSGSLAELHANLSEVLDSLAP